MISAQLNSNLAGFNRALRDYIELSKKTPFEAVQKQSAKLGFALSARLRLLMPAKGSILAAQLARLSAREGVRVRPTVQLSIAAKFSARSSLSTRRQQLGKSGQGSILRGGKRLNLQALMVQRELTLREQGRGYTGFIARFAGIERLPPGKRERWFGKYKQIVSDAGLQFTAAGSRSSAAMELAWTDQPPAEPGQALSTPAAQQALAGALAETEADMQVYIERKQKEDARILERF